MYRSHKCLPKNKALIKFLSEQGIKPVSETAALNPDWVEWLMGFPKGWTDVSSGPPNRKESPA